MSAADCRRYQEMISALLDGELSSVERAELTEHITGCDTCSTICVAFAAASGALTQEALPDTLHEDIMAGVRAKAKARKRKRVMRVLRPSLAAAACLVVIVGAVFAVRLGARNGSATTSAAGGAMFVAGSAASEPVTEYSVAASFDGDTEDAPETEEAENGFADTTAEEPREAQAVAHGADAVAESTANDGGALFEMELEVVSIEDGMLTGTVLSDVSGNLGEGEIIEVVSGESEMPELRPGDRVTVRYYELGAEEGVTSVTAAEIVN